MGRGGKKGSSRGGRARNHGDHRREDNRVSFDKVPKTNEKFERYYNHILEFTDEERSEFWDALRRELPNSFRFTGSKEHAIAVQKLLKERYIPQISEISHHDGTLVKPPEPIPWYPDELAWSMSTPKSVVRRFPPFAAFQKYLVSETSVGNISRQEVVSMIPPLVMDLNPGMVVLDMCAAPGSKAAQLLEMIHTGEEARMRKSLRDYALNDGREINLDVESNDDNSDFGRATGLLIANDSDYKRSHMLIHQLKRLSSPNLIVTNHDATMYPSIKLPSTPQNPSKNRYLKFDRILADVPCSGDGTTRKNLNLWREWNPGSALGLHTTQVNILLRALQMLKVGGRVVYSTCSMNPVENEAVICSAISRCGGLSKVKLLSCDEKLPLLRRRPGLKKWSLMDKMGNLWSSWNEVNDYKKNHENIFGVDKLKPGMFPPTIDSPEFQIPLQYCMRVYAHSQDTGGFFIAVLEKQSEFRTKPGSETAVLNPSTSSLIALTPVAPSSEIVESVQPLIPPPKTSASSIATEHIIPNDSCIKRPIDEVVIQSENSSKKKPKITENMKNEAQDKLKDSKILPEAQHNEDFSVDSHEILEESKKPGTPSADSDKKLLAVGSHDTSSVTRPNRNRHGAVEEPFKYISNDHPEIQSIESFYKLSPHYPRDRFMVRNAGGQPVKTIYYTSKLVRDILTENEGHGIKFIHGGVKMFMKQDVQGPNVCKWRIQSEGMPIIEGYVGKERVICLNKKETLRKLLIEMFPKVADGAWQELGEIGEQVRDIGMGCLILRINPGSEEDEIKERMVLPLWRSAASLNLMLAKEDRAAMLLRMFNDSTPLVNHSNTARAAAIENCLKKDLEDQHVKDEEIEDPELEHDKDTKLEISISCETILPH